jgi:tetratricopeptide (TPR) repeat protein
MPTVEALGKPALALKHFEHVKDAPDLLFGLAQARGRASLAVGDTERAVQYLQESLALQADDAQSHYLLALALMQQGAPEDGRRLLRQATLLDPTLGPAHFELGVLYLQQGDYDRARASCELAVKHLPGVALPLNNLALALKATGHLKEAAEQFELAVQADPKYADAWGNLFIVRSELGLASAAQARTQAVKLSPQLAELLDAAVGAAT